MAKSHLKNRKFGQKSKSTSESPKDKVIKPQRPKKEPKPTQCVVVNERISAILIRGPWYKTITIPPKRSRLAKPSERPPKGTRIFPIPDVIRRSQSTTSSTDVNSRHSLILTEYVSSEDPDPSLEDSNDKSNFDYLVDIARWCTHVEEMNGSIASQESDNELSGLETFYRYGSSYSESSGY